MTGSGVWRALAWSLAVTYAARQAVGLWHLRRTLRWVDQPTAEPAHGHEAPFRLHMVIPVLREQPHIGAALRWFIPLLARLPRVTLTIVTTEREEHERERLAVELAAAEASAVRPRRFPQLSADELAAVNAAKAATARGVPCVHAVRQALSGFPSSRQVVADELHRLGGAATTTVGHVHYRGSGRKAAQVNHAVAALGISGQRDYVTVYDIDSRPTLALLGRTLAVIADRARVDGQPPAVLQQSARFVTAGTGPGPWQRAAARAAAQLQTLWTLRWEVPSFRRYEAACRNRTGIRLVDALRRGLAQTVGHGLLVRADVFCRLGGLPTFTTLDDLPFGFRLSVEAIPVHVVPFTLVASAPEDVHGLVSQGARWFSNYLDYPRCARRAGAEGHGQAVDRAVALGVGLWRGVVWALSGPATLGCALIVAGRLPMPVRLVAAGGLWLGIAAPLRVLAVAEHRTRGVHIQVREASELFVASLLDSVGPLLAVARHLGGRATQQGYAPKTHHRGPASGQA